MISKEELQAILEFSKLEYDQEEMEVLREKVEESLSMLEILDSIDTEGVEPLFRVFEYEERLREDVYDDEMALTKDEVLMNTKEKEYGFFKLLNIMD